MAPPPLGVRAKWAGHHPWQQFSDPVHGVIRIALQHMLRVRLRTNAIEFEDSHEAIDDRSTLVTTVGAQVQAELTPAMRPVNSFKQHGQLRRCQNHQTAHGLRPYKTALHESFSKQAQVLSIPRQQLDDVTATATAYKDVAAERILFQHTLSECGEPIEAPAHVDKSGIQPNPHARSPIMSHLARQEACCAGSPRQPSHAAAQAPPTSQIRSRGQRHRA